MGEEGHSLYVNGLNFETSSEELRRLFEKYGKVRDVYIPQNFYNGKSRGFGYVEFLDREDAADAIHGLHKRTAFGRQLYVEFAKTKRRQPRQDGGGPSYHGGLSYAPPFYPAFPMAPHPRMARLTTPEFYDPEVERRIRHRHRHRDRSRSRSSHSDSSESPVRRKKAKKAKRRRRSPSYSPYRQSPESDPPSASRNPGSEKGSIKVKVDPMESRSVVKADIRKVKVLDPASDTDIRVEKTEHRRH